MSNSENNGDGVQTVPFYCFKNGLGRDGGNTNFGEHWSKSPGDSGSGS